MVNNHFTFFPKDAQSLAAQAFDEAYASFYQGIENARVSGATRDYLNDRIAEIFSKPITVSTARALFAALSTIGDISPETTD